MTSSQDRNPVEVLADDFVARFRRGERPALTEYADKHPELADEIRELFPLLVEMEDVRSSDESGSQPGVATMNGPELKQLGDYRIIREVGRGGMGIVYEAEQVSLGRRVALKVLPKELLANPKQRSRFEREAKAAAWLHHTNIVPVFGVGEDDGRGYYVMQFIQGLALDEVLEELKRLKDESGSSGNVPQSGGLRVSRREVSAVAIAQTLMTGTFQRLVEAEEDLTGEDRRVDETIVQQFGSSGSPWWPSGGSTATGRLSDKFSLSDSSVALPGNTSGAASTKKRTYWESVALIGVQVAEALEYAHGQGILHRDIKPANLLLDMRGTVWVTDFGLAKLEDERNLTQTGDILGTLRYMSPESFKGQADARSEIYSLGLTLYELLALRPAFDQKHRGSLVEQAMNPRIERLGKLDPEIPADLQTILHKAIEPEPEHRYATAGHFAQDLQRFVDDEPIQARRIWLAERFRRWSRRNKGLAASLSAVVLLITAVAIGSTIAARRFYTLSESEKEATAEALVAKAVAETAEAESRENLYATDMQLAPHIWADEKATLAQFRSRLDAYDPNQNSALQGKDDPRGFEWYYQQHKSQGAAAIFRVAAPSEILPVLRIGDNPIHDFALTPHGELVTLTRPAEVKRFDLLSRIETHALDLQDRFSGQTVSRGALSPRGDLVALGVENKVHVLRTSTGDEVCQIDSTEVRDRQLVFSSDGRMLVTVDEHIKWSDTSDGRTIAKVKAGEHRIFRSASLSEDGLTLALGGDKLLNGEPLVLLKLDPDAKEIHKTARRITRGEGVQAAAISSDEKLAAFSTESELAVDAHKTVEQAHASHIATICFGPKNAIATGARDGTIKTWRYSPKPNKTVNQQQILKGHEHVITKLLYSPDGKQLASASMDGTVRIWDLSQADASAVALPRAGFMLKGKWGEFSPDGLLVAGRVHWFEWGLFDASTGQLVRWFVDDDYGVRGIAFSPDNRTLAIGTGDKRISHVSLWDIDTGEKTAFLPGAINLPENDAAYSSDAGALAFSPDGRFLVAGFGTKSPGNRPAAGILKVWEVASRTEVARLHGPTGHCKSVDFSDDGKWIASAGMDGAARVWDTATWQLQQIFKKPGTERQVNRHLWEVAFSPDGRTVAVGCMNTNLDLWDVATGEHLRSFSGHSEAVHGLVFSRDGNTLISGGLDATVRFWNVATGRELMQLSSVALVGGVSTLALSRDGKQLLTVGEDRIVVWSAGDAPWEQPDKAAAIFAGYLDSGVDFASRIRMFSENPRLLPALQKLQQLRPDDVRVHAALAATQANWFASRGQDERAAEAFDRLLQLSPRDPAAWLRTTGLLRLAIVLVDRGRYADATRLLADGSQRRIADGLETADPITKSLTAALLKLVDDLQKNQKSNVDVRELRGEVAGQLFKPGEKILFYTAAIELVSQQTPDGSAVDLRRLYRKRADAYVATEQWQLALDDYARLNDERGEESWRVKQALAKASRILQQALADAPVPWTTLELIGKPQSDGGATLTRLEDGSILASGKNAQDDSYRLLMESSKTSITAIRLETLEHKSLTNAGPGRGYGGRFNISWKVEYRPKSEDGEARALPLTDATTNYSFHRAPITVEFWDGHDYLKTDTPRLAVYQVDGAQQSDSGFQFTIAISSVRYTDRDPWPRNLGRFRISISDDPEAFVKAKHRISLAHAMRIRDPWARLAAADHLTGDEAGFNDVIAKHPTAIAGVADLHADRREWKQALLFYAQALEAAPDDPTLLAKQAEASVAVATLRK